MKTTEDAIKAIYYWQYPKRQDRSRDSFEAKLVELYRKADPDNKARLDLGWPLLGPALAAWEAAGDYGDDLFRAHGLMQSLEP